MKEVLSWKNIYGKSVTVAIVVGLFVVISCFRDLKLLAYWPWFVVVFGIILTYMLVLEYLGRRRHRLIIHRRCLHWLTTIGFTVENIGDYWGYKGTYRSYFIRIYYDWNNDIFNGTGLCFMVYFQPPVLKNGQLDVALLNRANAAVTPFFGHRRVRRAIKFEASYFARYTQITSVTSRGLTMSRLDRAVDTVVQNKLKPIQESAVHQLVKDSPLMHGPDIDYFQRAYGAVQ